VRVFCRTHSLRISDTEHQPLSNVQRELLTLFAHNVPERHLQELKSLIARFLMERAIEEATAMWDERGYSDESLVAKARSGKLRAEL
jgi:hypothetical protein